MKYSSKIETIKRNKQNVIDQITLKYGSELFGTPPDVDISGKIVRSTPPNMKLIEKLYA